MGNHLRVLKHGQSLSSSRVTPQGSARITPYTLSRANSSGSKPSSAVSVPEMTPICDRDTKRAASEELRSSEKTPASESVSAKKSILLPKSAQHKDHELLRDLAPLLDGRHTEEEIIHKHPKLNEGAQGYKALKRLYETSISSLQVFTVTKASMRELSGINDQSSRRPLRSTKRPVSRFHLTSWRNRLWCRMMSLTIPGLFSGLSVLQGTWTISRELREFVL